MTAASLQVTGVTANNKFYDATTNASLSGTAQITPVSGDDVMLSGGPIATFADPNANTNISVSVIGYSLTGDDAGNYTLQQPTGLSADILPAPLTIVANDDAKFVTKSDAAGYAGASFDGFVGGESIADLTGALSVTRSGTDETAGFYSDVLVPTGFTSTNYDITYVNGDFTIVPADQLLVRFGNTQSVYGTANNYAFLSAEYMDGSNSVHTLAAPTVVGDSYTFNDGAGGTAEFTLSPVSEQLSSSGSLTVGSYVLDAANVTSTSVNFSNQLVVVGNHAVVAAPINVTGSNVTKTYDGTTGMSGLTLALSGNLAGDDLSITGAGAYADRNVGTGISYTVGNLMLDGADKDNYYLANGGTISANDGVILAKNVTLVAPTASRTYDGTNAYVATAADLNWLTSQLGVAGDLVQSVVLTFDNKNVGTGKALSASNVVIDDANGGANYNISYANDTSSEIVRLGSVTWIGGPTGNWSDPSNWAGGAIPDLANVADVIIPDGVTPIFDSSVAGPVDIESLTGGNFQIDSGTLNVAHDATLGTYTQNGGIFNVGGNLTVADFAQNDGTLGVGGNLNVTSSFTQNPTGTIDVTGNVLITQATGDLDVWNLTGHDITLNSPTGGVGLGDILARGTLTVNAGLGDINQLPGTILTVYGPSTFGATGNVTLNNPGNDFRGPVNVTGQNVTLRDDHGGLILGNVTTTGTFTGTSTDGPITQNGTGILKIGGESTFHARKNGNPADILLGNPGNDFQGPVNADGKDIVIHDGHGGLLLGTILASGNFTGKSTDGDITQTASGTITVHGTTTLEAFKNGVPADILLPNPTNQFMGLVNIVARQLQISDVDGSIEFGSFRTNEFDRMFAESSQSGVYDTNVRHEPTGSISNGGLAGYVLRTVNRLAQIAGFRNLFENAGEPVVAKDILQEQGEVYVRRETDFETVPVNSTSNDDDDLDDVQ
ncbi:MAG: YDG domain-containing protein [Pirellulaceae bacterium]